MDAVYDVCPFDLFTFFYLPKVGIKVNLPSESSKKRQVSQGGAILGVRGTEAGLEIGFEGGLEMAGLLAALWQVSEASSASGWGSTGGVVSELDQDGQE